MPATELPGRRRSFQNQLSPATARCQLKFYFIVKILVEEKANLRANQDVKVD
jgi:hypothetical protein